MVLFEKHGIDDNDLFKRTSFNVDHFPCHFHRAFELIVVRAGKVRVVLEGEEPVLEKNDLAFIFPNEMHEIKVIGQADTEIVLFSPEMIGDFFSQYKGKAPDRHVVNISRLPDFQNLKTIYKQKGFIYSLCGKLVENNTFHLLEGYGKNEVIYQILSYIDAHYQQDCSLTMMTKSLKYDYYYLSKLFVDRMNMTFTEYLNQYRILHACYLLKNTDRQIGDVASDCGYNNLKTFHRNFHKILGKSPSLYRKLN